MLQFEGAGEIGGAATTELEALQLRALLWFPFQKTTLSLKVSNMTLNASR
jgi:hypothetical protein